MFASVKEAPTQQVYQYVIGQVGSGNTRGAFEFLDQYICDLCNLNFRIVGEKGSIIWVQATSYNKERKIELFEAVEDTTL